LREGWEYNKDIYGKFIESMSKKEAKSYPQLKYLTFGLSFDKLAIWLN